MYIGAGSAHANNCIWNICSHARRVTIFRSLHQCPIHVPRMETKEKVHWSLHRLSPHLNLAPWGTQCTCGVVRPCSGHGNRVSTGWPGPCLRWHGSSVSLTLTPLNFVNFCIMLVDSAAWALWPLVHSNMNMKMKMKMKKYIIATPTMYKLY